MVKITMDNNVASQRGHLIEAAIKFLENPQVRDTSLSRKLEFLRKKGLSDGEMSMVLKRVAQTGNQIAGQNATSKIDYSSRLRDILNILLLIGGFSYGIRYLWKKYIYPWLYGAEKDPILTSHEALLNAIRSLQTSVQKMQLSLEEKLREDFTQQRNCLNDIKQSVQSVNNLLLGSRSFPRAPVGSVTSLPAWQMEHQDDRSLESEEPGTTQVRQDQSLLHQSQEGESELSADDKQLEQPPLDSAREDEANLENGLGTDDKVLEQTPLHLNEEDARSSLDKELSTNGI